MKSAQSKIFLFLVYALLAIGMTTYAMPVLKVKVSPLGAKSWSVRNIVESLPELHRSQSSSLKIKNNFLDVLLKIAPKKKDSKEPQKVSFTFILGALVPIALVLTYFLLFLGFFIAPIGSGKALGLLSLMGIGTAGYTLFGVYYLGAAAQRSFEQTVEQASSGTFGIIAKNFVPKIAMEPDTGLFALFFVPIFLFVVNTFRKFFE